MVGFIYTYGTLYLERDGDMVLDKGDDDGLDLAECEKLAAAQPDTDWRIFRMGPLHGETYQRQFGKWVCIERNQGFA